MKQDRSITYIKQSGVSYAVTRSNYLLIEWFWFRPKKAITIWKGPTQCFVLNSKKLVCGAAAEVATQHKAECKRANKLQSFLTTSKGKVEKDKLATLRLEQRRQTAISLICPPLIYNK